jgi:outer membrane protein assembly factor BamE
MRKFLPAAILLGLFNSACTIHTIDIQQGNVIEMEAVEQLKIGMTAQRVRFLMGSPLLQDPFHKDRWDYVYSMQDGANPDSRTQSRVTVFFKDGKLAKIDKNIAASN